MPKRSVTTEVLAAFMRRERLSQIEVTRRYGITRLASVVFELRKRGHDIITETVTRGGRSFAVYYLNPIATTP